jgi:hypothetical protein
MASYRVSYKVLRQQGEDMKSTAKLIDGYSERVAQVSGKLGEGDLLVEVRTNLGKLREQFGESRLILNMAGEFLTNSVESYTGVELRQVKKADATRAHNRDFYKNPVVVASVGGAAAGAAAAVAAPAPTPTVNFVDNSVNVNYVAVESAPVAAAPEVMAAAPAADYATAPVMAAAPAAAETASAGIGAGIAAGIGVLGGALGAGAVIGVKHLVDEDKKDKAAAAEKESPANAAEDAYDPEAALAKAIARVKELEEDEN